MWLYPYRLGGQLLWIHPCTSDIIANLISSTNREGESTNSNLELAALVLREATLLAAVPDTSLAAPHSGSDNTPTVSWSMKEASMINPVVADLLRIRLLHARHFFIVPSVFITQALTIAWQMTPLAFLTFLTLPFLPTWLLPILSRTVCGNSPSCRWI